MPKSVASFRRRFRFTGRPIPQIVIAPFVHEVPRLFISTQLPIAPAQLSGRSSGLVASVDIAKEIHREPQGDHL